MKWFYAIFTAFLIAASFAVCVSAADMSVSTGNTDSRSENSRNTAYTLSFEIEDKEYYTEESIVFKGETDLPDGTNIDAYVTDTAGKKYTPSKKTVQIYLKNAGDQKNTLSGYVNCDLLPGTYTLVLTDPVTGTKNSAMFRIIAMQKSGSEQETITGGKNLFIDVNDKEYFPQESIDFTATTNLPVDTSFTVEISGEDGTVYDLTKLYMTEPYISNAGDKLYTIKGYAESELTYPNTYRLTIKDGSSEVSAFDLFRVVGFGAESEDLQGELSQSEMVIRVKTEMTGQQTGLHLPGQNLTVSALTTFEPGTELKIKIYEGETHELVFEADTTVIAGTDPNWNNIEPVFVDTEGWEEGQYILEASEKGGISDTFRFNLNTASYNQYENQNENKNESKGVFDDFFRFFFGFFNPQ